MVKYKELDLINNQKLIMWLNIISFGLIIPFVLIFSLIAAALSPSSQSGDFSIWGLVFFGLGYFGLIFIHELIHGLFFKHFDKDGKVKYGFKNGLAYATNPGALYKKSQFYIIILAPFVIISVLLTLGLALGWLNNVAYVLLASLHGGACIGDFYWTYLVAKEPKDVYVEDTEAGMNFHR